MLKLYRGVLLASDPSLLTLMDLPLITPMSNCHFVPRQIVSSAMPIGISGGAACR